MLNKLNWQDINYWKNYLNTFIHHFTNSQKDNFLFGRDEFTLIKVALGYAEKEIPEEVKEDEQFQGLLKELRDEYWTKFHKNVFEDSDMLKEQSQTNLDTYKDIMKDFPKKLSWQDMDTFRIKHNGSTHRILKYIKECGEEGAGQAKLLQKLGLDFRLLSNLKHANYITSFRKEKILNDGHITTINGLKLTEKGEKVLYYLENTPPSIDKKSSIKLSWQETSSTWIELEGWLVKNIDSNPGVVVGDVLYGIIVSVDKEKNIIYSRWGDTEQEVFRRPIEDVPIDQLNFNTIIPIKKVTSHKSFSFIDKKSSYNFEKETTDAEDTVRGTLLERFNTIIFDLDNTLWQCVTPKGEGIGAYETSAPYKFLDALTIQDIKGNIITLQEGVKEVLDILDLCNKNLGIVSRGEKLVDVEKKVSVPFASQPSTMLLKKFDIFKYFNLYIIYKAFGNKADLVKSDGNKTLFIDDDKGQLDEVNQKGEVDVLWRKSFINWKDLLEKYYDE